MQLIGMLDSPYVRRVAVSLQLLGVPFEHQSVSVFRGFAQFQAINPVVKAPTLVCDDGTVLMDSGLIIEYGETLAGGHSLMPAGLEARRTALRILGLALAACEKSVQIVYEHHVRPADKLHAPWLERVTGQMQTALEELEAELRRHPQGATSATMDQAGLTAAVVWHFIQAVVASSAPAADYPTLAAFSAQAELLPEFVAAPHGDGVYRAPE